MRLMRYGLLAALLSGCAGQRDNVVETPCEKETSYEMQLDNPWTPLRDVPIDAIDRNGNSVLIYRGKKDFLQTYRYGDKRAPIHCCSEEDFNYFFRKGEYAIFIE